MDIQAEFAQSVEDGKTLFDRFARPREQVMGIRSGLSNLDATIRGFTPGKLYTVGGRPGAGKTSFATSIVASMLEANKSAPVLYISTELLAVEILEQVAEAHAGVPFYPNGNTRTEPQAQALQDSISAVQLQQRLGLLGVIHSKRLSLESIDQAISEHCARNAEVASLVIIDQASRISRDEENGVTWGTEKMLNALEELADLQSVPVVLLSQLKREADGVRPSLADYKWSGAFEEYSHCAMLLWRQELCFGDFSPWLSWIIVAKNRHGPTKDIQATFQGECHKWSETEKFFTQRRKRSSE